MPFNGLTSFLQNKKYFPYLTTIVSMPFNGLTSFLRDTVEYHLKHGMYQCPLTGLLHFYMKIEGRLYMDGCINAL